MNFQNCYQIVVKMAEGGPSPADIPGPPGPPDIIPDIIPVDLGKFFLYDFFLKLGMCSVFESLAK